MRQLRLASYFLLVFSIGFGLAAIRTTEVFAAPNKVTCQTGFDRPLLFGVNPNPGSASALQTVPDTGSTLGRVSLHWDRIQPSEAKKITDLTTQEREEYNFPIRKWHETGMVLTANISGTPDWAKDNPALPVHKAQPRREDAYVEQQFRAMVYQIVSENKDKVKYWSYWNEPNGCMSNIPTGECGSNRDTAGDYVHWLNIFFDEVHRADPDGAIVIGGNLEMVHSIANYIGYMNDANAKYDLLGVNPYHKDGNYPFPYDWVKEAYEKQKTRKNIFLNEWGFDSKWSGMNEDIVKQRITEAFGILTRPENNWIVAAGYHNVRDVDDSEGLRDETGLRPRGVEFKRIVQSVCNPVFGDAPPPPPPAPSCVMATQDIYDFPLRANQTVTVSSLASTDIKRFIYRVYNLDNKVDGIPQPYCVAGATTTAPGCPTGSGQLVVEGTPNGIIQALSIYNLPNGQLAYGLWRGNQGWTKNSMSSAWNAPSPATALPGAGDVHTQDTISANNGAQISYWRGPQGYTLFAPYNANGSAVIASGAEIKPVGNLSALPGSGQIIAQDSIIVGNRFYQFLWRQDGHEFSRSLPVKADGLPDFNATDDASKFAFTGRRVDLLPGESYLQATDLYLNSGRTAVNEIIWRNNKAYEATIPIVNNVPKFDNRTAYTGPVALADRLPNTNSAKTGSYTFTHVQLTKPDLNTGWQGKNGSKVPQNLQINATFETTDGKFIGNDIACVTSVKVDRLPGDFDKNCTIDLLDFNQFKTHYKSFNCNVNLIGSDCYIDLLDFNQFKEQYKKSCTK